MASVPKSKIVLPRRPFLYTIDQIASMLGLTEQNLKVGYVHYEGRSVGKHQPRFLMARNIAPPGVKPEWRVADGELTRWMKLMGFRLVDRGYWL